MNWYEKQNKYFSKHVMYTSVIHAVAGVGFGLIIARPFVDRPVMWGLILLGIGTLGHLVPFVTKK